MAACLGLDMSVMLMLKTDFTVIVVEMKVSPIALGGKSRMLRGVFLLQM